MNNKIECRYKSFFPGILCRLRVPFKEKLSLDERKEIVLSLGSKECNVPSRYEEVHETISNIIYNGGLISSRDVMLTTFPNGMSCVEIILKFYTLGKFRDFVEKNKLVAKEF